jgi:hypothetical protein
MLDLARDLRAGKPVVLSYHLGVIESNGLKFWFKYIGLGSVQDVERIVGVKVSALKERLKVHPRQFVAMCIGLKLIEAGYISFCHESKMLGIVGMTRWILTVGYSDVDELLDDLKLRSRAAIWLRMTKNKRCFIATAMGLKIVE